MNTESAPATNVRERRAHPWHGVDPQAVEGELTVFIENPAFEVMKYEVDAASGLLKVDHPLAMSAVPPSSYGFVPRTLCGPRVAQMTSRLKGDRAALDVFVLSERPIRAPGVLAQVRLLGGIPVRDETFVDDKLIAVLSRDANLGHARDISDVPVYFTDRIAHFLNSVSLDAAVEVGDPFGRERAETLLAAAMSDYAQQFPRDDD